MISLYIGCLPELGNLMFFMLHINHINLKVINFYIGLFEELL